MSLSVLEKFYLNIMNNKILDFLYKSSSFFTFIIFIILLVFFLLVDQSLFIFKDPLTFKNINEIFSSIFEKRNQIYSKLLLPTSIFFGFTMTSLNMIISLNEEKFFKTFYLENNIAPEIFSTYKSSLKHLALTCLILVLLILFDKIDSYNLYISILRWCVIFTSIKSIEKIFWNFIILKKLVENIKQYWRIERENHIKKEIENARANVP